MKAKKEILRLLKAHKMDLTRSFGVRYLALFGSFARGDQRSTSDVDILVNVHPSIGLGFVSLAEQLEKILHRKVDLVSTRALKPAHRRVIQQDAIRV